MKGRREGVRERNLIAFSGFGLDGKQGGSDTHGETKVPATFRWKVYVRPGSLFWVEIEVCTCLWVDYKVPSAPHPSSDLR